MEPNLGLYRTNRTITYAICTIVCAGQLQTEIALIIIKSEYMALFQAMRDVLPFVILMKDIKFVLELQRDTPKVLCGIFEKKVRVKKDNQGATKLAASPQI